MLRVNTLADTSAGPFDFALEYPDADGCPMADNSVQFDWIQMLSGNLAGLFRDAPDVVVGGDMLWYAVEDEPNTNFAPDVFVVFGRPKKSRGSYKQWEEDDVPMTVVVEILSPRNTDKEMEKKLAFYDDYGVEEYYLYDPAKNELIAYTRGLATLRFERVRKSHTSKRLGVRFDMTGPELAVYHPDGRRFLAFGELAEERDRAERRADRLADLMRKQLAGRATPEEVAELQRLLNPPA